MSLTSWQEGLVLTVLGPDSERKRGTDFSLAALTGLARAGDESIGRGVLAMAAEMIRRRGEVPIYLREIVADALKCAAWYVERKGPTPVHVACRREGKRGNKPAGVKSRRAFIWSQDAFLIGDGVTDSSERAKQIAGEMGIDLDLVRREMKARERWELRARATMSKADALIARADD